MRMAEGGLAVTRNTPEFRRYKWHTAYAVCFQTPAGNCEFRQTDLFSSPLASLCLSL